MPNLRPRQESSNPRRRRVRPLALLMGAVFIPPLIWAAVIWLVPTECARKTIVESLSQSTGRVVRLSSVRLGALGGVRLDGLEIAEKTAEKVPWLKAEHVTIDVSLLQLLSGRLRPSEVKAEGVALQIHRRADGTLELGDLCAAGPIRARAAGKADEDADAAEIAFHFSGGRISIVDEYSDTRLEVVGVQGEGAWQRKVVSLAGLRGNLNGGLLELSAVVDRNSRVPAIEGQAHAKGVGLGAGMKVLSYLAPMMSDAPPSIDGRLDLDLYLKGSGRTALELSKKLTGQGRIALEPIKLDNSAFVAELARVAHMPTQERVGSVRSDFEIGGGRISTKNLTLKMTRVPIVLAGWTAFDGRIDYQVKTDQLVDRIAKETHGLLEDLGIDANDLASLRVRGSLHHLEWTLADVPLHGRAADDRKKLEDKFRQIGRQLKDRIRR